MCSFLCFASTIRSRGGKASVDGRKVDRSSRRAADAGPAMKRGVLAGEFRTRRVGPALK